MEMATSPDQAPDRTICAQNEKVAILLCTWNGARFLDEQLDSIEKQLHTNWVVWASDDGSKDSTLAILEDRQSNWGEDRLKILKGLAKGFIANFLSLLVNPAIVADYYAFADQDDIWEADKLGRALNTLSQVPKTLPSLYCSRTQLIDERGREIGLSPLYRKKPSFANALVQNIGGGNTMVMNRLARDLMRSVGEIDVACHDWWTYTLIAGAGGSVFYDPHPSLRYRQHGSNLIGSNLSDSSRLLRLRMLLRNRLSDWIDQHTQALQSSRHLLTEGNRWILDEFCRARGGSLISRLSGVRRSGVYRQTWLDNIGLVAATVFKKL